VIARVHAHCDSAPPADVAACVIGEMAPAGAPPAAVAFTRRLSRETNGRIALLRDFRATGLVSVARVVDPMRATQNEGWWLVNGDPTLLDVDEITRLPQDRLARDPIYAVLAARYPALAVWPGDRSGTASPEAVEVNGGGQRFTVSYWLQNGCQTCERVGHARFAFDFDAAGKFAGVSLVSVTDTRASESTAEGRAGGPSGMPMDAARVIRVREGETFTLTLHTERPAGQSWQLASKGDESIVTLAGNDYEAPRGTSGTNGGRDVWVFKALRSGIAQVAFTTARSAQSNDDPKTVTFTIVVQ
jgi:predicted secreted protein